MAESNNTQITQVKEAVSRLMTALGIAPAEDTAQTPERVASLWREHLLRGQHLDPAAVLGSGIPSEANAPVLVTGIGVHMVCPHHLTVSFGTAHIAYQPTGHIVGFGRLSELVHACTQRLVLQEEAGQRVVDTLMQHLGAHGAVACIRATHPCHNALHPQAYHSLVTTWSQAGDQVSCDELKQALRDEIAATRG